jgi:hypothetical protein
VTIWESRPLYVFALDEDNPGPSRAAIVSFSFIVIFFFFAWRPNTLQKTTP